MGDNTAQFTAAIRSDFSQQKRLDKKNLILLVGEIEGKAGVEPGRSGFVLSANFRKKRSDGPRY